MNLIELDIAVKKWACDRGIDRGDGIRQGMKSFEEFGELNKWVLLDNIEMIKKYNKLLAADWSKVNLNVGGFKENPAVERVFRQFLSNGSGSRERYPGRLW